MILLMQYMVMIFGVVMILIGNYMPGGYVFFILGMILIITGPLMVHLKLMKTRLAYFLENPRNDTVLWLYVRKGGEIDITPAFKRIEGMLESPEHDALVHELKAYRMCGHSVRLVAEGHGHAADLGLCLYAQWLKRNGIESLHQARGVAQELMEENNNEEIEENYEEEETRTNKTSTVADGEGSRRKPYTVRGLRNHSMGNTRGLAFLRGIHPKDKSARFEDHRKKRQGKDY